MTHAAWAERTSELERRLAQALEALARVLDLPSEELAFRPEPGAWSALEVVEHVTLTNRFLGHLIDKIARRSRARLAAGARPAAAPARVDHLRALGTRALAWKHPQHMAPTGLVERAELRARLVEQSTHLRALLAELA